MFSPRVRTDVAYISNASIYSVKDCNTLTDYQCSIYDCLRLYVKAHDGAYEEIITFREIPIPYLADSANHSLSCM